MKSYRVDKNIPLTPANRKTCRGMIYAGLPLTEMDVGDSFAFPPERHHSIASAVSAFGRRHKGWKFYVSLPQLRCWRIS